MSGQTQRDHTYSDAIATLNAALAILDAPEKAIGYDYGLRRGQIGHAIAARARDQLRHLRDSLVRYEHDEEAQG